MTDTPRTDSQLLTVKDCSYVAPHPSGEYVHAEFARELERENAALKEELAPLRETVGVRGDAVTSRDDIAYWCKLMDRAGKADRLECENAALKDCLDWAETILSNSLPMQHSTLDEWNEIINKWRDSKHTIDDARKEGQA